MSESSVFAHVILRSRAPEPAATLALEYLLANKDALTKFSKLWPPGIPAKFKPHRVESEKAHGETAARPDLLIFDENGTCRVIVENKFWAGLTEHQPVEYLKQLPGDSDGALLLFIVPKDRVVTVWRELLERCKKAEVSFTNEQKIPDPWATLPDGRTLAVTSWRRVLEHLSTVAAVSDDVSQLRRLTDTMNDSAFLPLRPEELTCRNTPDRMINYADLVEQIKRECVNRGVASTQGLRPAHGFHSTGRYVLLRDRIGSWLGIELQFWRRNQQTPISLNLYRGEWYGVEPIWTKLRGLFRDSVIVDEDTVRFPIRLRVGAERETVVRAAADQITAIADVLVRELERIET